MAGRKAIYDYREHGLDKSYSAVITIRLPVYSLNYLDELVKDKLFRSRSHAIHELIMSEKDKDALFKKIKKLEEELEIKEKENEALRRRIKFIEDEKKEVEQKYHELLKEHEAVISELMQLKNSLQSQENKEEQKQESKEEKEEGLKELLKEYQQLKEKLYNVRTEYEQITLEREQKNIQNKINAILEQKGVDKAVFWKTFNVKGVDKALELLKFLES